MSEEYSDEGIINELLLELEEAKACGRKPIFYVKNDEAGDRIKRLMPIAEERFKKGVKKEDKS